MSLGEILLIPGVTDPLTQLKSLLFKQGQAGGIWVPSLSPSMISGNSFGTGVQTFLDLSGNGKNATQASSGSRPAWGRVPKSGRRNLLTYSEDITESVYSAALGATVLTESSVEFTGVNSLLTNEFPALLGEVTFSVELRCDNPVTIRLRGRNDGVNSATLFGEAAVTSEWTRFFGTATGTGAGITQVGIQNNTDGSTRTIEIRKLQINTGATAGFYQKVTTAFDITESGQRDCYYLQPDGVDDGMATASIDFSGTDKVTVFAAVRKLSDAANGVVVESGASALSVDGTFAIFAPTSTGTNDFRFAYRGTTTRTATASSLAAPITRIITGTGDIAAPSTQIRANGTDAGSSVNSLGTGNLTAQVLNVFARNGAGSWFNGQCFGLIVAGGSYPLSTIQRVERILSRYTPEVSL